MSEKLKELLADWYAAKEEERQAVNRRRKVEDALNGVLGVNSAVETSKTLRQAGFVVKVATRFNRKVNGDRLQDIAAEFGLTQHLSTLFRWKPELNVRAWESADPSITAPLEDAITTSAGRPSYLIEPDTKEKNNG
jgi:hypothetical protein